MLRILDRCKTKKAPLIGALSVVVLLAAIGVGSVVAETTCRPIKDFRWPGLEECITKARIVSRPASQKQPLWCWAASLSMIYGALGHPISQESIVMQNFGSLQNLSSGPFSITVGRMNRTYKDDNGDTFTSSTQQIYTMDQAREALDDDIPLLYSTNAHATVQTELTYQQAPGGPMVIKGGKLWDPLPTKGWRTLDPEDVRNFEAAWAISID